MSLLDKLFEFYRLKDSSGDEQPARDFLQVNGATFVDDPVNNTLTMSVAGAGSSTYDVVVESASDLPTPAGGIITLLASTSYFFRTTVSVGTDKVSCPGGVTLVGENGSGLVGTRDTDAVVEVTGDATLVNIEVENLSTDTSSVVVANTGAALVSLDNCKLTAADGKPVTSTGGLVAIDQSTLTTTGGSALVSLTGGQVKVIGSDLQGSATVDVVEALSGLPTGVLVSGCSGDARAVLRASADITTVQISDNRFDSLVQVVDQTEDDIRNLTVSDNVVHACSSSPFDLQSVSLDGTIITGNRIEHPVATYFTGFSPQDSTAFCRSNIGSDGKAEETALSGTSAVTGGIVAVFDTLADLAASPTVFADQSRVHVKNSQSLADWGGGSFMYFAAGNSALDDGGVYVDQTAVPGIWIREFYRVGEPVPLVWFGMRAQGVATAALDTDAFERAFNSMVDDVYIGGDQTKTPLNFPTGVIRLTKNSVITDGPTGTTKQNIVLTGNGPNQTIIEIGESDFAHYTAVGGETAGGTSIVVSTAISTTANLRQTGVVVIDGRPHNYTAFTGSTLTLEAPGLQADVSAADTVRFEVWFYDVANLGNSSGYGLSNVLVRDIKFRGDTAGGTSCFANLASPDQNWRIQNCDMYLRRGIWAQGDILTSEIMWLDCRLFIQNGRLLTISNPQSVVHSFDNCHMYLTDAVGVVWDRGNVLGQGGGHVSIRNGTCILDGTDDTKTTALIQYVDHNGGIGLGPNNNTVEITRLKPEIKGFAQLVRQETDVSFARVFFNDCNLSSVTPPLDATSGITLAASISGGATSLTFAGEIPTWVPDVNGLLLINGEEVNYSEVRRSNNTIYTYKDAVNSAHTLGDAITFQPRKNLISIKRGVQVQLNNCNVVDGIGTYTINTATGSVGGVGLVDESSSITFDSCLVGADLWERCDKHGEWGFIDMRDCTTYRAGGGADTYVNTKLSSAYGRIQVAVNGEYSLWQTVPGSNYSYHRGHAANDIKKHRISLSTNETVPSTGVATRAILLPPGCHVTGWHIKVPTTASASAYSIRVYQHIAGSANYLAKSPAGTMQDDHSLFCQSDVPLASTGPGRDIAKRLLVITADPGGVTSAHDITGYVEYIGGHVI